MNNASKLPKPSTEHGQKACGHYRCKGDMCKTTKKQVVPKKDEHAYYDVNGQEWAKKSELANFGEDISGSARHVRNKNRNWDSIEDMVAHSSEGITISQMEAQFGEFELKDQDPVSYMVARNMLDRFPKNSLCFFNESENTTAAANKLYASLYGDVREFVSSNIGSISHEEFRKKAHEFLKLKCSSLKNDVKSYNIRNAYIDFYNRTFAKGGSTVTDKIEALKTAYLEHKSGEPVGQRWGFTPEERATRELAIADKEFVKGYINKGGMTKAVKKGKAKLKETDFYSDTKFSISGTSKYDDLEAAKSFLSSNIKGGQFGNSLSDKERELHTVAAARSFEDLELATGLPIKKLTLDGNLSLAFGARGSGTSGAKAHYEPGKTVINLSRKKGFGSLSHELAHAIDNYEFRKYQPSSSVGFGSSGHSRAGVLDNKPELKSAFAGVSKELDTITDRMRNSDSTKGMTWAERSYWLSKHEVFARTFEGYVHSKLENLGRRNTYLTKRVNSSLWASDAEMDKLSPLFDKLMEQIKKS